MLCKKIQLTSDENVTLTTYISDISDEMENMKVKPAVLILPGGGYRSCSDREAEPIALFFVANGYNAFVLRYSLNEKSLFPKPLKDAQKALDLIIKKSDEWCTDKTKIAVCGFSAGGHLAAALATLGNPKPAACILGYPCILNDLGDTLAFPIPELDSCVSTETPPTFIVSASNDNTVPIEHSLKFSESLSRNKIPFEMHIFSKGGHGFSLGNKIVCSHEEAQKNNKRTAVWPELCIKWLDDIFVN